MSEDDQGTEDDRFPRDVGSKEQRKLRARRERNRNIWFWLGMMGLVGWTVSVPTLIGVAIGWWLDQAVESRISWTLTFMVLGMAAGVAAAWYWVSKESRRR